MRNNDHDKPTSIWGDLNDMMKNVMIPPPGAEGTESNVNEDIGAKVEQTSIQDNPSENEKVPNEHVKKINIENEPIVIPNGNDNKAVESSAEGKLESAVSDVTEDKKLDLEEGEIE